MKKHLLATSAMIAAGVLASGNAFAQAEKIKLSVGGYYEQWFGFGSVEPAEGDEISDFDIQEDGEIHFQGSTTLDNGLTFGVQVELESQTDSGDQIDESYLFVRGDFGEIVLGDENGAAYTMGYGLPSQGAGLDSGDGCNFGGSGNGCSFELAVTTGNFARRDNDSTKVRWISPRIQGIQVGASYAPEATQDDDGFPSEASNEGTYEQVMAVAANYDNKFGDTHLRFSAGYQHFGDTNGQGVDDPFTVALGARVGFAGFTLSGAWAHQEDRTSTVETRQTYGLGVQYVDGPIGVSLGGVYGDETGVGDDNDVQQYVIELGGKYVLGPGVEVRSSIFYWQNEKDEADEDATGFSVIGGIKLAF